MCLGDTESAPLDGPMYSYRGVVREITRKMESNGIISSSEKKSLERLQQASVGDRRSWTLSSSQGGPLEMGSNKMKATC